MSVIVINKKKTKEEVWCLKIVLNDNIYLEVVDDDNKKSL